MRQGGGKYIDLTSEWKFNLIIGTETGRGERRGGGTFSVSSPSYLSCFFDLSLFGESWL